MRLWEILAVTHALFFTAAGLKCYECADQEGRCTSLVKSDCSPKADRCGDVSVFDVASGQKQVYKGCAQRDTCVAEDPKNNPLPQWVAKIANIEIEGAQEVTRQGCCRGDLCNDGHPVGNSVALLLLGSVISLQLLH